MVEQMNGAIIEAIEKIKLNPFSFKLIAIKQLYNASFPKNERIPFTLFWFGILKGRAECIAYYSHKDLVGFSYTITSNEISYLFFLAVEQKWQNRGIGTDIIKHLARGSKDKPLIVTIEPIDDCVANAEQRLNRLRFYERNSFKQTPFYYHEGSETYQILTTKEQPSYQNLVELVNTVLKGFIKVDIN